MICLQPSRILLDNNRSIEGLLLKSDLERRSVRILSFKFQMAFYFYCLHISMCLLRVTLHVHHLLTDKFCKIFTNLKNNMNLNMISCRQIYIYINFNKIQSLCRPKWRRQLIFIFYRRKSCDAIFLNISFYFSVHVLTTIVY